MKTKSVIALLVASIFIVPAAQAAPILLGIGSLSNVASDLSGLTNTLENGKANNLLGGMGSGIAYAGGNTFLLTPDRGPNADIYAGGAAVDNTTSYIDRFHTVTLDFTASTSGLPFTVTPTLTATTLLSSDTPLNYAATGAPANNSSNQFYFTGRSDNFAAGTSLNPTNARLDPEAIRVSNDGKSVFIADEYGPYVYQFDRTTGTRIKSFALPSNLGVANISSNGATEISGNTSGRVANKGMEGLAITPDGKTLVGFMQSALIQDGGDGAQANRIVTIDIASGVTKEFAYDNKIGSKNYNSSEILAINATEFLVLERDGKGLGDGSSAVVKQLYKVDLTNATDISLISGQANLLTVAPAKSLFMDLRSILNASGISDANIPAKIEGITFGQDVVYAGKTLHTLIATNDNDFDTSNATNTNKFFVFGIEASDLNYVPQTIAAVPEPETYAMLMAGLGLIGFTARRRKAR
ncbi:MAG: esterase-like activity of phytase family protein [Bacteroidia bacterium]|nr:esterase-like activity of phytase family protein [Methylotenera sp.]